MLARGAELAESLGDQARDRRIGCKVQRVRQCSIEVHVGVALGGDELFDEMSRFRMKREGTPPRRVRIVAPKDGVDLCSSRRFGESLGQIDRPNSSIDAAIRHAKVPIVCGVPEAIARALYPAEERSGDAVVSRQGDEIVAVPR